MIRFILVGNDFLNSLNKAFIFEQLLQMTFTPTIHVYMITYFIVTPCVYFLGVDSTQPNDSAQEESVKCTNSDNNRSRFPPTTSTTSYIFPTTTEYAPRLGAHSQWGPTEVVSPKSPNKDYISQFSMSGGPPHNPHGRQAPTNSAWNHLQVF